MANKVWFKRKKYGWGWTPASFLGWATVFLYVILTSAYPFVCAARNEVISFTTFIGIIFALTFGLIGICFYKGEKPMWK